MRAISAKKICSGFNRILKDELMLSALLELAQQKKLLASDLKKNLSITKAEEEALERKITFLENEGYVQQNPCKNNEKPFDTRKYLLSIKGMFFLNKVKATFPEHLGKITFFF